MIDNTNVTAEMPKSWGLWTVWSASLGALMDSFELSTAEFASEIIAVIQEKDYGFHIKEDEDIQVIRPTKLLDIKEDPDTGAVRVEIGGTIFRPGTRNDAGGFGKRWRLIATNQLATVFHADKKFIPHKICNEIFVVINGRVLEPARQIWMDDYDRETRIIRLIDEQIQPGMDDRYLKVSHKFRNYWKRRGSPKHAVLHVTPYSSLLNTIGMEKNSGKRHFLDTGPSDETPPSKSGRSCNTSSSKTTSSSSTKDVESECKQRSEDVNGHNSPRVDQNWNDTNKSCGNNRLVRTSNFEDYEIHDSELTGIENDVNRIKSLPTSKDSKQVSKPTRGKSGDTKTYHKLSELETDLTVACSGTPKGEMTSVLKNKNVYGIVEQVIQVPRETVKIGESKIYLLRISDETKRNVLVRLCTNVRGLAEPTILNAVGPLMSPEDIIRIHRATVQFETSQPGVKELVISTAPHLNYAIFSNKSNIDAPLEFKRLAKDTIAIKDGDEDIVRSLRVFSAQRTKNYSQPSRMDSSAEDIFYDTRSHVSSEESFEAVQVIEEIDVPARTDLVNGDIHEQGKTVSEELLSGDDSDTDLIIMIPDSEKSGDNDSEAGEAPGRSQTMSGSNVQSLNSNSSVIPAAVTVSQISLHESSVEHSFILRGSISDMIEVFEEDSLYVTITDGTKPTLNFKKLIEFEHNPIYRDRYSVDIAIENISQNMAVESAVRMALGTSIVFKNVQLRQISGGTDLASTFELFTQAKNVFAELK
ncbi:unnamed protein product [Allacma fusca]|uniref:Uncharacterized protein n=1 Tax=Allacma fusca TaxID=39272 RepID=A0A8J2LUX0_9HEXA|nr:unnamed protein product [Allacma fusca]